MNPQLKTLVRHSRPLGHEILHIDLVGGVSYISALSFCPQLFNHESSVIHSPPCHHFASGEHVWLKPDKRCHLWESVSEKLATSIIGGEFVSFVAERRLSDESGQD